MTRESCVVHLVILMPSVLYVLLTSVKEVVTYGWTTCTALAMKVLLRTVRTMDGTHMTALTVKMHQSSVQVSTIPA